VSHEDFDPHNPACWVVLRRALLLGWHSGIDQTRILRESRATSSLPSLSRFIDGHSSVLKDHTSAKHLWNWCARTGFLTQAEKAIADDTPDRGLATALQRFYRTHASQMAKLVAADIEGFYFSYKLAFRHSDFMVRSIWQLARPADQSFLLADEFQYSSGHYESDKAPREERSSGAVISKSERLWFTLREDEHEQPRVICLDTISKTLSKAEPGKQPSSARVSGMSGHVLEATRKGQHLTFHSPILFLRADEQRTDLMGYHNDVDILPLTPCEDAASRFAIPAVTYQRIVDFLRDKKPFFDPKIL
jgi:hypothetical protein